MCREEAVVALMILAGIVGCGGTTTTGTKRNIDVGGDRDGSVGGSGGGLQARGGAIAAGGVTAAGGISMDPCAGVRCASLDCGAGFTPVTLPGACCPTGCEGHLGEAGVVDASVAEAGTDGAEPQPVDCASSATCPAAWCDVTCCPGSGECAPCCVPKACQGFDAARCPLDRCQVMPTCAGTSLCYPFFTAPPPPCGGVGYYGNHVPCCDGAVLRCGLPRTAGTCDLSFGGYDGFPMCIACGDGSCDSTFENACNCPEDCH